MQHQAVSRRLPIALLALFIVTAPATARAEQQQDQRLAALDVQLIEAGQFGAASIYDPWTTNEPEGIETASGELYDPETWTAAIRTDLRAAFGGIHYGRNYHPAFALIECGDKRAIVRVNDVGPLRPGRVIDFNLRTMRYFDPGMSRGLVQNVTVTPLPGEDWVAGPLDEEKTTTVALSARSR